MAAPRRALLIFAALAHALLVAHGQGDLGGSAEGSGDDEGSATPPMVCREPDPRPSPPLERSQVDAVKTVRCHVACIEEVFSREGVPLEPAMMYPVWPMIFDSVLERNCSIYHMVHECRRGCLTTGRKCQKQCGKLCEQEVYEEERSAGCSTRCDEVMCVVGCSVADELDIISNQTQAYPLTPVGRLQLSIVDDGRAVEYYIDTNTIDAGRYTTDAGLYTMNVEDVIPNNATASEPRFVTGFIARITLDRDSVRPWYIWMASFEGILNLSPWACREIQIQLQAVNKYGEADHGFGPKTSLTVYPYGESRPTYPSHPDEVRIQVSKDTREGYWKHAVINVSWKKPRKGFELLQSYEVIFSLLTPEEQPFCKANNMTVYPIEKTSDDDLKLTIQAATPRHGPVSDCKYTVQVKSISSTDESPPSADIYDVHINSSATIPVPLNFICNRTWDSKSGDFFYKLDWIVPDDTAIREAIGSFDVITEVVSPDGTAEQLNNTHLPFSMSQTESSYHYSRLIHFDSKNYVHRITMKSNYNNDELIVLLPSPHVCTYHAEAIPPPQVENVEKEVKIKKDDSSRYSFTLVVMAQWSPVETDSVFYRLRLGEGNASNSDDIATVDTEDTQAVFQGVQISEDIIGPCLYIQVRAVSQHNAEGLWSDPLCIELPARPSPVTANTALPTPTDPPQGQSSSSSSSVPQVAYIAPPVILVLIASVSILAVAICLIFLTARRNNKRKNRRRANTVFMTRKASDKDKYTVAKLDQWEVYSNQVAIQSRLGEGAFGDVYRGMFNSTITEKSDIKKFDANNSVVVAVKLQREDALDMERQIFLKHILQAKKVAQYPNPHLVCLVGCVTEQEPLSLLTEYPEQGDLLTYLRAQRHEIYQSQLQLLDYPDSVSGRQLPTIMPQFRSEQSLQAQDLMLFISHVAAGLEHLASIGVVHGDVACRNLFLTADKVVKIADFGLDSILDEEKELVYVKSESGRLPIRWMAIESIRASEFSTSSDVWAFGVTLWEIASLGGFPYHDTANTDILATLSAGQRLECPANCSEEIYGIMLKCCAATPSDRPSFSTLHHVFKSLHSTATNGQYITLNVDQTKSYYLTSPRSSTSESHDLTDDYALLMEPTGMDSVEVATVQHHVLPHSSVAVVTSHPPPVVQHSHTASFSSYTHSENAFLPCIAEEGEDVSDNDEETGGEGEGGDDRNVKRDSGNDSTFSQESGKVLEHKYTDREEPEDISVLSDKMEAISLL